ncbi:MAG: hypothetical protein ABJZ69_04590, partial [Hyphomicrobiales bacterium]
MDNTDNSPNSLSWFVTMMSAAACVALGVIALYSSGIGLLDPKMHRAGGFALALIVGIAASRLSREKAAE